MAISQELKIIFLGTPEFGALVLAELIKSGHIPCLAITSPDKPVGRKQIITPPPVKIIAERNRIPVLQSEKIRSQETLERVKAADPDLIILASFNQMVPGAILDLPKKGSLNIHPSLLPQYRGPSPIQSAILNGEKETGVTIMLMNEEMDKGPILSQKKLAIADKETASQLHDRLALAGAELLIDTIPDWVENRIKAKPQDEELATYTKILKKEDGKIDWQKEAAEIERQIRAFDPWPGAWTLWKNKGKEQRVKILKAEAVKECPKEELCIKTGKDLLLIEELQPEGKKPMSGPDFIRGHAALHLS